VHPVGEDPAAVPLGLQWQVLQSDWNDEAPPLAATNASRHARSWHACPAERETMANSTITTVVKTILFILVLSILSKLKYVKDLEQN